MVAPSVVEVVLACSSATAIVSALQGAMMLAVATGNLKLFDQTLDGISEMAGAA